MIGRAGLAADLEFDGEVDITPHVLLTTSVNDNTYKPRQRRHTRHERDEYHPEPQEQVDLLVEQVDR